MDVAFFSPVISVFHLELRPCNVVCNLLLGHAWNVVRTCAVPAVFLQAKACRRSWLSTGSMNPLSFGSPFSTLFPMLFSKLMFLVMSVIILAVSEMIFTSIFLFYFLFLFLFMFPCLALAYSLTPVLLIFNFFFFWMFHLGPCFKMFLWKCLHGFLKKIFSLIQIATFVCSFFVVLLCTFYIMVSLPTLGADFFWFWFIF